MGPLLPVDHVPLADGDVEFADLFDRLLERIFELIEQCALPLELLHSHFSSSVRVLLQASHADLLCAPLYPTLSPLPSRSTLRRTQGRITLLPDPCRLALNGVEVQVTSVDYLKATSVAEWAG